MWDRHPCTLNCHYPETLVSSPRITNISSHSDGICRGHPRSCHCLCTDCGCLAACQIDRDGSRQGHHPVKRRHCWTSCLLHMSKSSDMHRDGAPRGHCPRDHHRFWTGMESGAESGRTGEWIGLAEWKVEGRAGSEVEIGVKRRSGKWNGECRVKSALEWKVRRRVACLHRAFCELCRACRGKPRELIVFRMGCIRVCRCFQDFFL